MSLNCGWQPFRRALAWRCRRSSDGNSCSFTSVALPWHRAGRLAARSRDTTSCSLSCWYRRANHRRTAEPWGRVHSLGSSGSWYRSGLMLPRGTQPQEPQSRVRKSKHSLYTSFVSLFLMSNACIAVLTYSRLSESLSGCADLDGVPIPQHALFLLSSLLVEVFSWTEEAQRKEHHLSCENSKIRMGRCTPSHI